MSQNEPQRSLNGASTIVDIASWIIQWRWKVDNLQWTHRQHRLGRMLVMISRPPPTIECPQSVNSVCGGSERYTAMNCIVLFLNRVLCGQSLQSDLADNITNMHAMSDSTDIFTCTSTVNIWETTVCCAVSLLSAGFQVGLPSIWILPAMSDWKSLKTSLLEVMISSQTEHIFIRDLSDLTLQIIFEGWWASMNVGSKQPIAQNDSRRPPSWWLYIHCGIEEISSPGMKHIVGHQVLRHPSELRTSSIGKHLLVKAHITKWNEIPKSEVTALPSLTVDETALAILKKQGSRGITIVSSQRKIRFDIQVDPFWPKWQITHFKLAAKDFETSESPQDMWNRYLMLGFVSARISWYAITNLELQRSYKVLCGDLVVPSATTPSNSCRREYALTVDAIKKQLLLRNKVSFSLVWWTSTNKLAITSVIGYYINRNWALCEVQLAFDEIDHLFFSPFES